VAAGSKNHALVEAAQAPGVELTSGVRNAGSVLVIDKGAGHAERALISAAPDLRMTAVYRFCLETAIRRA